MCVTKEFLIEKLEKNPSIDQIKKWVNSMTNTTQWKVIPNKNKVGDVFMHPIFQHPCVLMEKKENGWLCGLLTSEPTCSEILCKADSRFYYDSFFTEVLFMMNEINGRFHGIYDNDKHIKQILHTLKKTMVG